MLTYRWNAFALDLGLGRSNRSFQFIEICVEKHCPVNDAWFRLQEKGIARNFFAVDHDVVPAGFLRIDTGSPQVGGQCIQIFRESGSHVSGISYVWKHYIAFIGIDAASTALSSEQTYIMLPAIRHIHFGFHHLIPSENDSRLDLPEEKCVFPVPAGQQRREMRRHVFLHREIEYETTLFIFR